MFSLPRLPPWLAAILLALAGGVPTIQAAPEASYLVRPDDSLGEIATRLYGTVRMIPEIAAWNHLGPTRALRAGQRLRLRRPPTLTPAEGDRAVLAMWRKRMGLGTTASDDIPLYDDEVLPPSRFITHLKATEAQARAELSNDERSAEDLLVEGERLLDQGQAEAAYSRIHRSRELNDDPPSVWLLELRALSELGRESEAHAVARALARKHAELRDLPSVRQHLDAAP